LFYQRSRHPATRLARWRHKILAHNYINASLMAPCNVSFSARRRDSGLLDCRRRNDGVRKLESARQAPACKAEAPRAVSFERNP